MDTNSKTPGSNRFRGFDSLFLCQFANLAIVLQNAAVIFSFVGNLAAGTVLEPILGIAECTAAAITQGIEGTIAEQAAEILRICTGMTGEVFTLPVLEIGIMLAVPIFHDKTSLEIG